MKPRSTGRSLKSPSKIHLPFLPPDPKVPYRKLPPRFPIAAAAAAPVLTPRPRMTSAPRPTPCSPRSLLHRRRLHPLRPPPLRLRPIPGRLQQNRWLHAQGPCNPHQRLDREVDAAALDTPQVLHGHVESFREHRLCEPGSPAHVATAKTPHFTSGFYPLCRKNYSPMPGNILLYHILTQLNPYAGNTLFPALPSRHPS